MLYLIIITNTISSKTNRQCQFCLLKFDVILLKQILIDVLMTGLDGFTLITFHFRIINLNTPDDDTSFSFFSLSLFLSFCLYLIFFFHLFKYPKGFDQIVGLSKCFDENSICDRWWLNTVLNKNNWFLEPEVGKKLSYKLRC